MSGRVAREALLVVGGRIGFVALWFLAVVIIYRSLGSDPAGLAQAGLFAVSIACVKIASGCLVDPGDVALMRRAPGLLRDDPGGALRLFRAALLLRAAATLLVVGTMLALAPVFSRDVLGHPEAAPLVRLVAAAIVGEVLLRSVMIVLQAGERFASLVMLEGAMQVARFVGILLLWCLDAVSVDHVLGLYAAASFGAALAGASLLMPAGLLASADFDASDLRDLLHFLKWMLPAMMLAAFNERLDVLLVYGVAGSEDAGRYGAVLTLAMAPELVAGSLSSLLQPRIARMRESGSYGPNLRRFLTFSLPALAVAMILAMPLARPAILLVLGPAFAVEAGAFLWVLAGTLTWLAIVPLPLAMVAVHAPALIALVTVFQMAIVLAAGVLLLPALGNVGMAIGVFAMRVAVAVLLVVMAQWLARPHALPEQPRAARPHAP